MARNAKSLSLSTVVCPLLFTAGVLGLTVDTFLKREFARDVFVAAFRYVLPDELKEEVCRIIGFLCIDSLSVGTITTLPHNLVRVHISPERTCKNITVANCDVPPTSSGITLLSNSFAVPLDQD